MPKAKEFDWWNEHVTNEIYLSTHRADWWKFCGILAGLLAPNENVLDVGTGDGHTFWQIISVASRLSAFRIKRLILIEPNKNGLRRAMNRCSELPITSIQASQSRFEDLAIVWAHDPIRNGAPGRFDAIFAGHVNYYLGNWSRCGTKESTYLLALKAMSLMAKTVILVTAPRDSDYYKLAQNPFGEYVYSDAVAEYYRSKGSDVKTIDTRMRFYVDHVNQSRHEAIVLWKFFNNTERQPDDAELDTFIARANETKDADGNIDFRDQILIVTTK